MTTLSSDALHASMANALRFLSMDAVEQAKSGHPGMPMGMADVATVLWRHFLRFDAKRPFWADRDRFILSAGHGSMLLYALGYLAGYEAMTIDEIKRFRQLGSRTPGHPEHDVEVGIEMTTGPLGQGISTSVGFALAERIMQARFGQDLVDHRTFVIASDGDLMEGVSHEAASLAGHLKLGRLIVFYDDNQISIDGPTSLSFTEDVQARFRAYGWHVVAIDGHDPAAIKSATEAALAVTDQPSLIACRTKIGCGAPTKQGTSGCHGSPLGADEIAATRKNLGWDHAPFVVPDDILAAWRQTGTPALATAWEARRAASALKTEFDRAMAGALAPSVDQAILKLKQKLATERPKHATRQSSGGTLEVLLPVLPELIGGSADLTPSNNTSVKGYGAILPPSYQGRYVHYGVREHGMSAVMNGMALHGGIIPYGGTFLQFADYSRPAIRLAALMGQRVVFVMTHDSIGLGEDGPTHQPVEHLAALRVIPNLHVFRPCDGIETAECWQIALQSTQTPSLMALSRQAVPTLRAANAEAENLSAKGGYLLAESEGARAVTLIATGTEVALAIEARDALRAKGIGAAVVSMPCRELFMAQDDAYRAKTLGTAPRIVIEAAVQSGWEGVIGAQGGFVGMSGFGASAPAPDLYKHFGITVEAVVQLAEKIRAR